MQNPMFLPAISVALYDRALKAAQQGQTCNVIMLCTASMEAFINEYLEFGTRLIEIDNKGRADAEFNNSLPLNNKYISYFNAFHPKEVLLINSLKENEKQRNNIFVKINTIRKHCIGDEWKKNHAVYRDYCTLVKLRNALTHPRSRMVKYGEIDIPKFIKPFYQQKDIDYFNEIDKRNSWVEAIDTVEFSQWCINSFEKMMILLLKDMYEAKIEDSPQFPLKTADHAFYYLKSFNFSKDLVVKTLSPL